MPPGPGVKTGIGSEIRADAWSIGVLTSRIPVGATPIFDTFGYGSVWVSNYDDDTISDPHQL